jgi:YegS/Rv2252/BmrU family lipid kinase
VLIIANPAAGRYASSRRRLDRVTAALELRGCSVVLRRAGPVGGDAERLARGATPEFDVVVAAGGDGTINAVANGLVGAPCALALLPLGTANVLAREIGLPQDPERLAELIATGSARPVWPGRVGERIFLTAASSGFDAGIVAAVNPRSKRRFGRVAFAWAILRGVVRHRACELVVSVDGLEHRAATVIAARSRRYAGPYVIAPQASLDEPMLTLLLFRNSGRLAVLRYLWALLCGRLAECDDVGSLQCRAAAVSAPEPIPVQADGELVGCVPVALGIAEQPLYLIRP